jgi:trimeric autotransporter adhesin
MDGRYDRATNSRWRKHRNANSFFGAGTGVNNTTGESNSFIGIGAGRNNTTGHENSYLGASTGLGNQTGNSNTFIGSYADFSSRHGEYNRKQPTSYFGAYSELSPNISNDTAIGWRALVTQSNSLVLGSSSDANFGVDTNVGIGTTAPKTKLHVRRGKIYIEANGQGMVMKAPNGSCFELTVSDAGTLTTTGIACP